MMDTDKGQGEVRTFKGAGLHELLPQIRAELGDDAVILARRDGVEGGFGGFFGRRVVEIDAARGSRGIDVRADDEYDDGEWEDVPDVEGAGRPAAFGVDAYAAPKPATPAGLDAAAAFDAAAAALRASAPPPPSDPDDEVERPAPPRASSFPPDAFADQLAGLMGDRPAAEGKDVTEAEAVESEPEGPVPVADFGPAFPKVPAATPPLDEAVPEEEVEPEPAPEPASPVPDPEVEPVAAAEPVTPAAVAPPAASIAAPAPLDALDDADALVAAAAPASPPPPPPVIAPLPALGRDGEDLLATGLSPALTADLVHTASNEPIPVGQDGTARGNLRSALAARIPTATPVRGPGSSVIAFVGPGGSGKTRCVARLATAYAKRSPLPVACITLRSPDGGAELTTLLEPAGVPVYAERDVDAALRRIAELSAETIVLIDTAAVSPRATVALEGLATDLRRLGVDERHLTIPATIGPLAARELARAGRALGVSGIALTHVDETAALGTVVELAIDTGIPLTFVARGLAVDTGMRPAAADALAFELLGAVDPIDPGDELV